MKLYATTTSERASKGQGGNNIEITVQNRERDILLRFEVKTKDERKTGDSRLSYFSKIIEGDTAFLKNLKSNIAFYLDTKGNQQKGDTETMECNQCGQNIPIIRDIKGSIVPESCPLCP